MTETKVDFGDQVTDKITGFKGTVIAITEWLHGCRRVMVQPKGLNKDGEIYASEQFDEPGLNITRRATAPTVIKKKTGGPRRSEAHRRH